MISSQLGRAVLGSQESSPDAQRATPGEDGGYDELMDAIDQAVLELERESDQQSS